MHNESYRGNTPSLCRGCRTRLAQLPATPSLHLGRAIGKTSHESTNYPSNMCGPRTRPGCDRVARRAHAPSPAGSSGTNTSMVPQYKREAASSPPVVCGACEQVLRTPSPMLAADAWQSHGRSCPGPEPRPPETAAWTHAGLDAGEHCHTWACGPTTQLLSHKRNFERTPLLQPPALSHNVTPPTLPHTPTHSIIYTPTLTVGLRRCTTPRGDPCGRLTTPARTSLGAPALTCRYYSTVLLWNIRVTCHCGSANYHRAKLCRTALRDAPGSSRGLTALPLQGRISFL